MLMTLVAILLVSGCGGGPSAAERTQQRADDLATLRPAVAQALTTQARAKRRTCTRQVGAFLDTVSEIDSRLTVGLTIADYTQKIGDAQVAQDQVRKAELSEECESVFLSGELAKTIHTAALSSWQLCIRAPEYCDDAEQQREWKSAKTFLAEGRDALARLGTPTATGKANFPRSAKALPTTLYGQITTALCPTADRTTTAETCAALRDLLAGGVTVDEESEIDEQIATLIKALGLKSS